jgi:hypothetical protein
MTEMEFPEFLIDLMIDLNRCIREGFAEETTTTVKDVTATMPSHFNNLFRTTKVHGSKSNWTKQ